jgi:hypothetical protein
MEEANPAATPEVSSTEDASNLQVKKKSGRPTNLTPGATEKICSTIRNSGISLADAAALVGVNRASIYDWCESSVAFSNRLRQAQALYKLDAINEMRAASKKDPKLLQWLLERHFPAEYAAQASVKHSHEVSGKVNIQVNQEQCKQIGDAWSRFKSKNTNSSEVIDITPVVDVPQTSTNPV